MGNNHYFFFSVFFSKFFFSSRTSFSLIALGRHRPSTTRSTTDHLKKGAGKKERREGEGREGKERGGKRGKGKGKGERNWKKRTEGSCIGCIGFWKRGEKFLLFNTSLSHSLPPPLLLLSHPDLIGLIPLFVPQSIHLSVYLFTTQFVHFICSHHRSHPSVLFCPCVSSLCSSVRSHIGP